ncbi:MAG: HepT-like ribonuclease domain-containing protein [Methylococcaceae bacterium]
MPVCILKKDNRCLQQWNAAIGLRNRIVYEYMNVDMAVVFALVEQQGYQFIVDFLHQPISTQ